MCSSASNWKWRNTAAKVPIHKANKGNHVLNAIALECIFHLQICYNKIFYDCHIKDFKTGPETHLQWNTIHVVSCCTAVCARLFSLCVPVGFCKGKGICLESRYLRACVFSRLFV